jgi:hypothetical protein
MSAHAMELAPFERAYPSCSAPQLERGPVCAGRTLSSVESSTGEFARLLKDQDRRGGAFST